MVMSAVQERFSASVGGFVAESVRFAYDGRPILEDIQFTVGRGEFVCLLGPSGSGKSTLLRLLSGLSLPDAGTVRFDGRPVVGPGITRGVVFQDYALFPWLRLEDNVGLAIRKTRPGLPAGERRRLAQEYLEMVGLGGAARKRPYELSGGMRQRGAIARALALGSPALLLDEPFGALDPINRATLQDLLVEIWSASQPRKTVVFVTHDVEEALHLSDRVIGLVAGRIIADVPLDLPRPRRRGDPATRARLLSLRTTIQDLYIQDARRRMDSRDQFGPGGGI